MKSVRTSVQRSPALAAQTLAGVSSGARSVSAGAAETALEITQSIWPLGDWTIWLRSDVAHTRCRFCYLRNVRKTDQVERLVLGITDRPLVEEEWNPESFAEALRREQDDCLRRYREYANKERHGRVPGQ